MSAPLDNTNSDTDKKTATQLFLASAIVMAVMGVLAVLMAGLVWAVIDFALAGVIGFFGYAKAAAGDYATPKVPSLIAAGIIGLLGLLALANAGAAGGLGFIVAIAVLGTAGALLYACMLISPGKKLF